MDLGIASVAAITVIAYLVGYIWKTADALNDKWIPCVCGTFGCIVGVVAYLIKVPDFPAGDVINAAAVGIVSGLAATGINQIGKQLFVKKSNSNESTDSEESEPEDVADADDEAEDPTDSDK